MCICTLKRQTRITAPTYLAKNEAAALDPALLVLAGLSNPVCEFVNPLLFAWRGEVTGPWY